jgi:discoidin domain receptor family member 2
MPQGDRRSPDVDLSDATYDGDSEDGRLSGGLGQLTDSEEGQSNFRLDVRNRGTKGYEWIGWRAPDGGLGSTVEITFRFDAARNFTAVRFHANNMFTKDVRVFRSALVSFSGAEGREGERGIASQEPIAFEYMRDSVIEYERWVMVPLDNRIGVEVTVRLQFDSRWMMISEVHFESGECIP